MPSGTRRRLDRESPVSRSRRPGWGQPLGPPLNRTFRAVFPQVGGSAAVPRFPSVGDKTWAPNADTTLGSVTPEVEIIDQAAQVMAARAARPHRWRSGSPTPRPVGSARADGLGATGGASRSASAIHSVRLLRSSAVSFLFGSGSAAAAAAAGSTSTLGPDVSRSASMRSGGASRRCTGRPLAHTLRRTLRRHAYPALGDRPLSSVRPSDVQAWTAGLTAALAPRTVGTVHGIVSGIFRAAVRDRLIVSNPCEGTRLPKVSKARVEPLPLDTVRALEKALPRPISGAGDVGGRNRAAGRGSA